MDFKLLFEIPWKQLDNTALKDAVATKVEGEWKKYSSKDFTETIQKVSQGLLEKEVEKGENIGMISFNRPEWNFIDIGMQQIGAINVPLYPNISKEDYKYILNHAEIKTVFVENKELFEKIREIKDEIDTLENIYTFDEVDNANHWTDILEGASEKYNEKIEQIKKNIEEDDLATIVYTSGTTGKPKGVMLSHKNIASNVKACLPLLPIDKGSRALSFLPLNHIFERMLTYLYMAAGVSIYYAENMDSIGDNLKEIKPNIFTTVPRLLEKVYEKIVAKGKEQNPIVKAIFFWALNLAKNYELEGKSSFYKFQLKIVNTLVFSNWRDALGGNIRLIISGGAPLNPKLARIFSAAQIPILEGYGLTETSPVIAVNRYEQDANVKIKMNQ